MAGNRSAAAQAARRMNVAAQSVTAAGGSSTPMVFDVRGFEKLTFVWNDDSSNNVARIGRALASTSTAHFSTGNLDYMTVTGSSGGDVGSTALDWPFVVITTATSGSTDATGYVGLR